LDGELSQLRCARTRANLMRSFLCRCLPRVAGNGVGTCLEADAGIDTVNAPDRHTGVVPSVTGL